MREIGGVENVLVTMMMLASKVWRLYVVQGWRSVATITSVLHPSRLPCIYQNTNQASECIAVQQVVLNQLDALHRNC